MSNELVFECRLTMFNRTSKNITISVFKVLIHDQMHRGDASICTTWQSDDTGVFNRSQ